MAHGPSAILMSVFHHFPALVKQISDQLKAAERQTVETVFNYPLPARWPSPLDITTAFGFWFRGRASPPPKVANGMGWERSLAPLLRCLLPSDHLTHLGTAELQQLQQDKNHNMLPVPVLLLFLSLPLWDVF